MLLARSRGELSFFDERDYHAIGVALSREFSYASVHGPTAFRPPGQPFFLAAVYAVFGPSIRAAELVQSLLLTTVPFAAARLARLVSRRPGVALAAAAIAALHPALSYAALSLYPVVLTVVTLSWGLVLSAEGLLRGRPRRVVKGAVLLGLAAACTPYFAPLPLVVAGLALRRRARVAALASLLSLLPLLAFAVRNAHTLGTFTVSTTSGLNLVLGANDEATPRSGNWIEPPTLSEADARDELTRDKAYRAQAHAWIRAHPTRWLGLSAARAAMVLDSVGRPRTRGAHDDRLAHLAGLALLPVVLLGVLGLFVYRRSVAAQLSAAALACVMLAAAPTLVKPRFRFPVDPALGTFAAALLLRRSR